MPMLQIDGTDVAEVTAETADSLLRLRVKGLGKEQTSPGFQKSISVEMRPPQPKVCKLDISLIFDS